MCDVQIIIIIIIIIIIELCVLVNISSNEPQNILPSCNNNIYLLQLGCHPVAVVILHVYKT